MKIKFRVWDKKEKCWLTYDDVFIGQEGDVYFIEERNWAYQSYMHKENITENVEISQYTGINSKNGKEIYEGDIVPVKVSIHKGWKQGWVHFEQNAIVEYVENEMCFMFVANIEDYGKQYIPFDKSIRQSYKIIGNIYENPELVQS